VAHCPDLPNVYLELTAVYAAHDFAMQPSGSGTPVALMSCLQVKRCHRIHGGNGSRRKMFSARTCLGKARTFCPGAVIFARITDEARQNILAVTPRGCWEA